LLDFSQPRLEAALIERVAEDVLLLAALMVAVLVRVRAAYGRVIGRPLNALTRSIETFERTNEHAEIPVEVQDELGAVIDTYNRMQVQQVADRATLDNHQLNLEREVTNRTRALETELSEHARTSALLSRERHHLHVTLDSINDAVITLDAAGFVQFLNPSAVRLTEVGQAQATGAALGDILTLRTIEGGKPLPDIDQRLGALVRADLAPHLSIFLDGTPVLAWPVREPHSQPRS
jgi:nitrogen fixation/metabolism regulation signal transduction histidine kinase